MSYPMRRAVTVALVAELVAVAVLAGFGPPFPQGVARGAGWSFLGGHAFAAAHALLGILLLVQAVALVVAAPAKVVPAVVVAGVAVAVAAGGAYVSAGQPAVALTVMTIAWLVALGAAVVELVRMRRGAPAARSGAAPG